MKIAIFSDTHDNIWRLDRALALMEDAAVMIHCGDLCSPFIIKHLGKGAGERPVHVVWGNNEGDLKLICEVADSYPNIELHGNLALLELAGVRVAVNHYPEMARALASSGCYDLGVCAAERKRPRGWVLRGGGKEGGGSRCCRIVVDD